MKQLILCMATALFFLSNAKAGDNDSLDLVRQIKLIDSVEAAMKWQSGKIMIGNGIAQLNIPAGFKFLNAQQSKFVLHDIWGNPPREDILGMIFPENGGPYADSSFAFIVSFEETGFVKDDDADGIDYAGMLKDIQSSEAELNKERKQQGYESIHLVKWAQTPYYDKNLKVLHWAKEFQFGTEASTTLNYDVRVLGRKGILSLNAVSSMENLPMVKASIQDILKIPEFTSGNKYSDFNSNSDKVAEYGLGALVAGGVLAKTGLLATIGKFFLAAWKFIAMAVAAGWAGIRKFIARKRGSNVEDNEMVA